MTKGVFGNLFDFNNDGKLDNVEQFCDYMLFNELIDGKNKNDDNDDENKNNFSW